MERREFSVLNLYKASKEELLERRDEIQSILDIHSINEEAVIDSHGEIDVKHLRDELSLIDDVLLVTSS